MAEAEPQGCQNQEAGSGPSPGPSEGAPWFLDLWPPESQGDAFLLLCPPRVALCTAAQGLEQVGVHPCLGGPAGSP